MKDWTVMVYMAGDNNLSDDMAFSLSDIQEFTKRLIKSESERVNLLAFFDSNCLTAPTQYYDFSDPQNADKHTVERKDLYHPNKRAKLSAATAATACDPENSASAHSIVNFVRWCVKTKGRTAKNYAIIFSGHSFGFHGSSFLRDESTGGFLTIFEFRKALEKITKLYLKQDKIGILGFDSCVMSMLEVGYELKNVAQTIVASEGSIPNSGWAYSSMLREFISTVCQPERASVNAKDAARGFVKAFIGKQKEYAVGGRSVDIAAWDLDLIEPVAASVSELADELHNKINLPRLLRTHGKIMKKDVLVFEQLKNAILQSHIYCQTYMSEQCIDLKDFCQRLAVECKSLEQQMETVGYDAASFTEIKALCGKVVRAVGGCVLQSGFCGDAYQYSNGVSMYFPWTALAFAETQHRYEHLRFNRGGGKNGNGKNSSGKNGNGKSKKDRAGIGSSWNDFLFYYLYVVTLRKKRGTDDADFVAQFKELAESDLAEKTWSPETKDNWRFQTRDNWRFQTRDNWRFQTRGEAAGFTETFGRFKNYQLDWELCGFSDADEFNENALSGGYFDFADDR